MLTLITTNVIINLTKQQGELQMERTMVQIYCKKNGHAERAFITEQGNKYFVEPYIWEYDSEGKLYQRHYTPYTLCKKLEGFEYEIYTQGVRHTEGEIKMKTKFNFTHLHANLHENKYGAYQEKIFEKDLNIALQNDYHMNERQAELVISHSKNICKDKGFEINAQELTAVAEGFGYTVQNIIHAK